MHIPTRGDRDRGTVLLEFLVRQILGVRATLAVILERMAQMADDQAKLDADVATVVAVTGQIRDEIAALQAANPGIDFSGLDSAVTGLEALVPAAPSGGTPTTA